MTIARASLEEIIAMKERGELLLDPNAPEGPDLPDEFWENAVTVDPPRTYRANLNVDRHVFMHFIKKTIGHGYLERMQDVLREYVDRKATE